jgi:hypothetical protein
VVDFGELHKSEPSGVDSPIEPLVGKLSVGANGNFVNTYRNTTLRLLSVMSRGFLGNMIPLRATLLLMSHENVPV